MWFDIYTCHLLLEKYPALEKAMEEASPAAREIRLTEGEESRVRGQIDWLMMKDGPELPERLLSPCLFRYIHRQFQEVFQPWDYQYYPRHYTPPDHPDLLKLEDYSLEDSEIKKVVCRPGGEVSLFFVGVEDHTNGGEPMEEGRLYPVGIADLELRLSGVPETAYPSLKKLDYFICDAHAVQREDGKLVMYLVTTGKHRAYFTFTSAELFPAPYGTYNGKARKIRKKK